MKKALVLASVASMIDQFNMPNIEILKEMGYEVHVIANFQYGSTTSQERVDFIKNELLSMGVKVFDIEINRNVLSFINFKAYKKIKKLISNEKYNLIHCHSPIGGVIARLAAKKSRNIGTRVIYTAHGFHFYKGAPLKNWMIFYPIERWFARYTDILITINKEDYNRAKKSFKARKVEYVPGIGIDANKLRELKIDKSKKRRELGLSDNDFIVLSVGELNKNKNHETVINAIAKLNNPNVYYVICGQGVLDGYLKDLVKELVLEKQVKLLGYRTDIAEISKASDLFVFPSFREGLSVALMEAMALGLPVVCSKIRGNIDLIEEDKGGYLVAPNDVDTFVKCINKLINERDLFRKFGMYNTQEIKKYNKQNVQKCMEKIYKEIQF